MNRSTQTKLAPSFSKHETIIAFLKALIANPRATGAVLPSSKYLAREMANQVIDKDKLVVELGAGTGIVTEMLLESGIDANNLIAVEYSHDLVQQLRKRFPDIRIIEGNAADLCDLLNNAPVFTIVSSIPLLSLPKTLTEMILKQIEIALPDKGRYIQFTYDLSQIKKLPLITSHKIYSKCVWRNIPPARVDVWEKNTSHFYY